jgi:nucleotide-binding universal stress UspA family protein
MQINEKANLIVIGTRGRSGLKKLMLGSVASDVVTYAHCPVLVVK